MQGNETKDTQGRRRGGGSCLARRRRSDQISCLCHHTTDYEVPAMPCNATTTCATVTLPSAITSTTHSTLNDTCYWIFWELESWILLLLLPHHPRRHHTHIRGTTRTEKVRPTSASSRTSVYLLLLAFVTGGTKTATKRPTDDLILRSLPRRAQPAVVDVCSGRRSSHVVPQAHVVPAALPSHTSCLRLLKTRTLLPYDLTRCPSTVSSLEQIASILLPTFSRDFHPLAYARSASLLRASWLSSRLRYPAQVGRHESGTLPKYGPRGR